MANWDSVQITVVPDPLWTPEMEAACRGWLALIDALERKHSDGGVPDGAVDGTLHTDGRHP